MTRLLRIGTPWLKSIAALTLGHIVLGVDQESLEKSRPHERVHVMQYERWGPFFIPLYLLSSAAAYMRGQNPYWDNRFEKEAYRKM